MCLVDLYAVLVCGWVGGNGTPGCVMCVEKKFFFHARFTHDRLVEPRYGFYVKATRWSNGRFRIKNLLILGGTI